MKRKVLSFENFKNNTVSKSQLQTVFGGNGGPERPALDTSSSSGAGATVVKSTQDAPILGKP
ncbi:rSAM-modified peptide [Flavobacterium sp. LS2P90]|uniref:RSAM-modified peptide n=1 Tax=Flavobacterium xylosi TaxID=3230415 RepID=A0ABW6HUS6_9FLAO